MGGRTGANAGVAGGRTGGGGSGMGWAPLRRDAASDRKWLARRAAVKEARPGSDNAPSSCTLLPASLPLWPPLTESPQRCCWGLPDEAVLTCGLSAC